MSHENAGVVSIGTYLPTEIRQTIGGLIPSCRIGASQKVSSERERSTNALDDATVQAFAAMAELKNDPFKGVVERRVRPNGMRPSEMETEACKDALARAGIDISRVGLILTMSQGPDVLLVSNAPLIHKGPAGAKTSALPRR